MEKQEKHLYFSVIDYSQSPGPRYCIQGDDSGEHFYHTQLNSLFTEAYKENALLVITLDGADGYASSFLDEAFGNLVYDFSREIVSKHLRIVSNDEDVWTEMIENETFPEWEKRRINSVCAKVTVDHGPWFRLIDGELRQDIWITKA
ncbi:MAG: STAS-like domain-containing protein [Bacteroidales bacterium]|nr:STAS-like domain-containing protein [Bacteroidales bacterium]